MNTTDTGREGFIDRLQNLIDKAGGGGVGKLARKVRIAQRTINHYMADQEPTRFKQRTFNPLT